MLKRILVSISLAAAIAGMAHANEPAPQQEWVTLHLPPAAVQLIGNALRARPYEEAAPLLNEMQKQIDRQLEISKAKRARPAGGEATIQPGEGRPVGGECQPKYE